MRTRFLVLGLAALPLWAADRLGFIDFFGTGPYDLAAIRRALPVREKSSFPGTARGQFRWRAKIEKAIVQAAGKPATDVSMVCCDQHGDWILFIGLPGPLSRPVAYRPAPHDAVRLPEEAVRRNERLMSALSAAVQRGGGAEDGSRGYALSEDPSSRALQTATREFALAQEPLVLRVLAGSGDANHRWAAAHALGYARQSAAQVEALAQAAFDADPTVRNNAVRALAVLVESNAALADALPLRPFVDLLNSGTWTDRNKALYLLTGVRSEALVALLRDHAREALEEMAAWRSTGHAERAKLLLARIR